MVATTLVQPPTPRPLLSVGPSELTGLLGGSGRAKLVWTTLRRGGDPFTQETGLGKKALAALHESCVPKLGYARLRSSVSSCGTRKLLLELERGEAVETVIIPQQGFSTICVSSQVGCRQACSFCATGTMGLLRSLGPEEILAQVHAAMAAVDAHNMPAVRNVVFMVCRHSYSLNPVDTHAHVHTACIPCMLTLARTHPPSQGMGEPADNLPAVRRALAAMVHPFGFGLAKQHVCVSTVGPSPGAIRALAPLPARLAWSVHAADDRLRKLLVPTSRHSMSALRDAWAETLLARNDRGLMAEVTLIDGVNDGDDAADGLHELLAPLPGKTRVNLIPYNANAGLGAAGKLFRPSRPEAVRAFQRRVIDSGLICTVRTSRGDEEASACGQLRLEHTAT